MPKAPRKTAPKGRADPLATIDKNKPKKQPKPKSQDKPVDSSTTQDGQVSHIVDSTPQTPTAESYLLLIRLTNSHDPVITRLLSIASNFNFAQFHEVLQIAFGWAHCHAHSFSVSKILEEGERGNFMTGRGQELLTLVPDDFNKDAYPDPETIKVTADYTLADIYDSDEYKGKVEVSYEYDHGDSWDHQVAFLGRADPSLRKAMGIPADMQVVCLGGEGHPCAEDCGSTPGWEDLKGVFKKKKDPEGRKEWYKQMCANGDPKGLDPWKWDVFDVNDELAKIKG